MPGFGSCDFFVCRPATGFAFCSERIPIAPLKFASHPDCVLLIIRIVRYFCDGRINLLLTQNPESLFHAYLSFVVASGLPFPSMVTEMIASLISLPVGRLRASVRWSSAMACEAGSSGSACALVQCL